MNTPIQICCCTIQKDASKAERIRFIGGFNQDGSRWKLSQAEAIRHIEAGKLCFYLLTEEGRQQQVTLAVCREGQSYLTTLVDAEMAQAPLLNLPECP
jgi:Protein of unknown function (DUF3892)